MSMVMDWKQDEWRKKYWPESPTMEPNIPITPFKIEISKLPSQQEIDEFYRLLEKARQYDKEHNQPNCELKAKQELLQKMAEALGVEIQFPS